MNEQLTKFLNGQLTKLLNGLWKGILCGGLVAVAAACRLSVEPEEWSDTEAAEATVEVQLHTRAVGEQGEWVTYPGSNLMGEQHATTVQLYIFRGQGSEAVYTGVMEQVGWREHFGPSLPVHTASMTYRLRYQGFQPGVPYVLLGVGGNDQAFASFDFPMQVASSAAVAAQSVVAMRPGTTLGEARAQLKTGAGGMMDGTAIRTSEIYVGTVVYMPSVHRPTRLTMYRRVAGVRGYFTQVPAQVLSPVDPLATDKRVKAVRMALYTAQNGALPLLQRPQRPEFTDFLKQPVEGEQARVVVDIPLPEAYRPTDVLTGGSYVLPLAAPTDNSRYTLQVELVNAAGQVLEVRRVKLSKGDALDHGQTGGGTGIIDTGSAYRFPLIANHYYAVGTPMKPIDLRLAGRSLMLTLFPDCPSAFDTVEQASTYK